MGVTLFSMSAGQCGMGMMCSLSGELACVCYVVAYCPQCRLSFEGVGSCHCTVWCIAVSANVVDVHVCTYFTLLVSTGCLDYWTDH